MNKQGFTMAEILLSLTIIGVVAAITLPSLTGNINERTWNTQRKALYARFSQAIALMPSLNGYGTLEEGDPNNIAETFVTSGLAKVMKINNICDYEHLDDCGIPSKITTTGNSVYNGFPETLGAYNSLYLSTSVEGTISLIDSKAAAFETQNGESIVVFYNPQCRYDNSNSTTTNMFAQYMICANFVFDLNGNKGPNTFGKDMGAITVLYPTDSSVVMPIPTPKDAGRAQHINAAKLCKSENNERLPNKEELASLFINKDFWNLTTDGEPVYWSSSLVTRNGTTYAWDIGSDSGLLRSYVPRNSNLYVVRCIKR